jgi:hypothetical protein
LTNIKRSTKDKQLQHAEALQTLAVVTQLLSGMRANETKSEHMELPSEIHRTATVTRER